jgi:hypothetical protein
VLGRSLSQIGGVRVALSIGALLLLALVLHLGQRRPAALRNESSGVTANSAEPQSAPQGIGSLAPRAASVIDVPLRGRVEGPGSQPVSGASVCFAEVPERRAPNCSWSDAAGNFTLQRGDAAPGTIYVSAAGYQSLRRRLASIPTQGLLVLSLLEGPASLTGTVSDASGGPIAGAIVRATSELGEQIVAVGLSGQDGSFRMDPPPAEHVVFVHAEAEGYSGLPSKVSTPARGLRLVLSAASSIVGRVIHARSREAVAGAAITATPTAWPWRSPRSVRSAADGSFRLTEVSTGVYSVIATSDRVYGELRGVALGVADTSGEVEILVEDAVRLSGAVSVDGERCPRATVSIRGAVTTQVTADAEGAVTVDGLLPGAYTIEVSCERALPYTESIKVGTDPITRAWNLERGLRVRGLARSASGAALVGARIDVDPRSEDKANGSCVTDEFGKFSCTGLGAGDYDCTIAGPVQPRSAAVHVSLPAQSNDWIELRAEASGTIRVRIEGSEKLELTSLPLSVHRQGASPVFGRWDAGELVFEPLGLGTYEIRSDTAPPGSGALAQLSHDGQVQKVSVTLAAQRLSGRVVDAAGVPMPDVWVRAESASLHGRSRPTTPVLSDEWGGFSLSGLLPGRYRVGAVSREREAYAEASTNSTDVLIRFQNEDNPGRNEPSEP